MKYVEGATKLLFSASVTNGVSYWASNLPYLLYLLWLIPVLLLWRGYL